MNTDPTIGSSGDATPTDLTDRLHANLDYRATQFTVAAPPLSDILHRSRRRQARRHAVGILAGAGAMAVAGVAVIARPEPETEITTAAENEQGTTPPGTVRADIEVADPNACPASGAWYLGLRGGLSDGASLYPSFSRAGNHDITTRAQVFLTGEGAYGGKALFASRTTLPAGVNVDLGGALVYIPSGGSVDAPTWVQTTPYRVYPSGLLGSMGPLLRLTNEMVANPVDVGGVSGMYIEYGDGRAEVQWQKDHSMVRVVGQEVSRDELLAAALSVVPHDDGGFEVAHVPASLVPVVNTGIEDPGSMQSIFYSRSGVSVTVGTAAMTREQFLAELANRSAGRLERRDVNGHDGWVVLQDDIESAATWYDEGRQAAAVITISPMQGSVPAGMLDSVLADVIDLPEADVEAFCARMRFFAAPPPANGSSSPWTGDGSSSPWTGDGSSSPWTGYGSSSPWTGDGSSSPWTTDTTLPDDGSSSPTVDTTPATTAPPPPVMPPPTTVEAVAPTVPPIVPPDVAASESTTTTSIATATTSSTTVP